MKGFFQFIWEILRMVLVALLIVVPIRYFLFQPFFVKGQSMEPTFQNSDYLIVDEISYKFRAPGRGEVVVFKYPNDVTQRFIKRIIGLPQETVEIKDGKVVIYPTNGSKFVLNEKAYFPGGIYTSGDMKVTLGKDEYFVLGDNRSASYDSRRFGILPKSDIIGRVVLRAWPFASVSAFGAPAYNKAD